MTLPTPAMTPSAMKLLNAPSGRVVATNAPSIAAPASIASIIGVAQANTAWNTTAITTNSPMVPGTGRFMKAATRELQVVIVGAECCTSFITSLTQAYR